MSKNCTRTTKAQATRARVDDLLVTLCVNLVGARDTAAELLALLQDPDADHSGLHPEQLDLVRDLVAIGWEVRRADSLVRNCLIDLATYRRHPDWQADLAALGLREKAPPAEAG